MHTENTQTLLDPFGRRMQWHNFIVPLHSSFVTHMLVVNPFIFKSGFFVLSYYFLPFCVLSVCFLHPNDEIWLKLLSSSLKKKKTESSTGGKLFMNHMLVFFQTICHSYLEHRPLIKEFCLTSNVVQSLELEKGKNVLLITNEDSKVKI